MIVIWRGGGFLAPVAVVGGGYLLPMVGSAISESFAHRYEGALIFAGAAIGGVFVFILGMMANRDQTEHSLYFIPVQYWGALAAIGGFFLAIGATVVVEDATDQEAGESSALVAPGANQSLPPPGKKYLSDARGNTYIIDENMSGKEILEFLEAKQKDKRSAVGRTITARFEPARSSAPVANPGGTSRHPISPQPSSVQSTVKADIHPTKEVVSEEIRFVDISYLNQPEIWTTSKGRKAQGLIEEVSSDCQSVHFRL